MENHLYDGIVQEIKDDILLTYKPHQQLDSERRLAQSHKVSRTTIRSALKQLEIEGYIYKQQGRGTFIAEASSRMTNLSKMYSFTDQMKAMGKKPETKILSLERSPVPEKVQLALDLAPGDQVYVLRRLRLADHLAMMVETSYIPERLFPDLDQHGLDHRPLYEIFCDDYHQHVKEAREEFFVAVVDLENATALGLKTGDPVFRMTRFSYNNKHQMIEWTDTIARGDQFRYQVTHERQ